MFHEILHNLTLGLFFLMTSAAFILGIFSNNAFCTQASAPAMIIGCCIYCLISSLIMIKCKRLNWKIIYPLTFVLLATQLFLLAHIITSVGWDCGILISAASNDKLKAGKSITDYLSIYPNNLFLFYLESNLFRLIRLLPIPFSAFATMDIFNLLCIDGTILCTSLLAGKLLNKKCILPAFYISVCFLGLTPWIIIPYSDTIGMLFPILSCYCYFCGKEHTDFKKQLLFLLSGIFFGIGYLIKPTAIIAFIAITFYELLGLKSKKKSEPQKTIPAIILGLLLLCISFQYYASNQTFLTLHSSKKTPLSHFLVLGTHYSVRKDGKELIGTYNEQDVSDMLHCPTTQEKNDLSLKKFQKRIYNFGLSGYLHFLYDKFRWITGDGMFSWGVEGHFINEKTKPPLILSSVIREAYYPHGKYIDITTNLFQAVWLSILLGCVISCFYYRKTPILSILRLTCIGTVLFILLFEGRARYMIISIPFYCLMATGGFTSLNFLHINSTNK